MREGGRPIDAETPPRPTGPGASFEMRAQDLRPVVREYAKNLRRQLFDLARAYGLKNPNDFSEEFASGRVPGDDMDKVVALVKKMTACFEKNRLPREFVREQEEWMAFAKELAVGAAAEMATLQGEQLRSTVMETLAPALVWTGSFDMAMACDIGFGSTASRLATVRALVLRGNREEVSLGNLTGNLSEQEATTAAGTAAVDVGDMETLLSTMVVLDRNQDYDAQKKLTEYALPELLRKGAFSDAERLIAATLDADIRTQSWITMAWYARLNKMSVESYLDRALSSYDPGETTVRGIRRLVAAFAENGRGNDPAIRDIVDSEELDEKIRLQMIAAYRSGNVVEGKRLQVLMYNLGKGSAENQIEEIRALLRAGERLHAATIFPSALWMAGQKKDKTDMLQSLSELVREEHAANRDTGVFHKALIDYTDYRVLDEAPYFSALAEVICLETELGMPTAVEIVEKFSMLCELDGVTYKRYPLVLQMHKAGVDVSRMVRAEEASLRRVSGNTQPFVWYNLAALQVRCGMDPTESIRHAESVPPDIQRQLDIRAKADLAMALAERAFGILKGNES